MAQLDSEEHQESVPENESIDDIFAGVEEIDDIPTGQIHFI